MSIKKNVTPKKSAGNKKFFIVGIGASAGGLEAISQLLSNLPSQPNIAFVIAQHLDPTHESMAVEIFSRLTLLNVIEVKDGMEITPDQIYVMPPNHTMQIVGGKLKLLARKKPVGQYLPIDTFFHSLAKDQKNYAIGIVLSGTGTDGTVGLQAIKTEGGITIAQDLNSAKYDGMPRSAIASKMVDIILPPTDIAKELTRITRPPFRLYNDELSQHDESMLSHILINLQTKCNVDFSHYKRNTLKRRIKRRMVVQKKETLKDYLEFLQVNADEAKFLFADILINVTEFFRDIKCFDALKKKVFPSLMKEKGSDKPIRIWVVGCATGEEAYSVAMALLEYGGKTLSHKKIQIFATDISETVIQHARTGIYPASITTNVSKKRLQQFFEKTKTGYRINKSIREMCLFSLHDIAKDPPFSKLDFICCRNLLIYFDAVLQKYILSVFYYALNAGGFLWLGKSESVGQSTLFNNIDKTNKLYSRTLAPRASKFPFPLNTTLPEKLDTLQKTSEKIHDSSYLQRETDRVISSIYAPPGVVVNNEMDIVLIRGEVSPYLQLNPGHASFQLFKMARPEIASDLRMLIQAVKKKNAPAKKNGLSIGNNEHRRKFNVGVIPLLMPPSSKERYFLVFFESSVENAMVPERYPQIEATQELTEVKAYQQSLIQDFEATQEELTSANEELQSTNEELQSTNEELETAKEELQSINEELTTVNDELQNRNIDLVQLNNDLTNLISCIDIPLVIVSIKGHIRRFTAKAGKIMNLMPSDMGRPISDFKPNINIPDLEPCVLDVIETITPREFEVQDREGNWFRLQIRPYKTIDNRIDGAVISLIDINILKKNLEASKSLLDYTTSVANTVQLPLVVLDSQLRVTSANTAFYEKFHLTPKHHGDHHKVDFFKLIENKIESLTPLSTALKEIFTQNTQLENFEIKYNLSSTEHYIMLLNAKKINWIDEKQPHALLLSILDITQSRTLQTELTDAIAATHKANQAKDIFLTALSHELRTPLTAILSWAQLLQTYEAPSKLKHGLEVIEQNALVQAQLIDDLLDISRIQSGKLTVNITELNLGNIVCMAVESVRGLAEKESITLRTHINSSKIKVAADPARLQQIVWNLLTNAIKFSLPNGIIDVYVSSAEEHGNQFAHIKVVDYGKGIKPSFLPKVFERFTQDDNSTTRTHRGLGMGLSIVHDLIKIIGGNIRAESEGEGRGATFTVILPLMSHRIAPKKNVVSKKEALLCKKISGLKVLIVEDEQDALDAFTELLHSAGVITLPTHSVAEALAALDTFKPDILISDISMPNEDGYSLIKKIRARKTAQGRKIKAVALTAYTTQEEVNRALTAGFDAHLGKPFKIIELFRLIEKMGGSKS